MFVNLFIFHLFETLYLVVSLETEDECDQRNVPWPLVHMMLLLMQRVFGKDRFSGGGKMSDAEIDISPFLEAHQIE